MIITFTLAGLVLLLVVILGASFYMNQEGFEQIEKEVEEKKEKEIVMEKEGFTGTTASTTTSTPATSAASTTSSSPSTPSQVSLSNQSYDAMEKNQRAALLRDIQKVIRNELIANRSVEHVKGQNDTDHDEDCGESDATAQGKDYKKNSFKKEDECSTGGQCEPLNDMTKYIRKDQIPCWGCNIDY